jgi:sterol desaturase/sphingolipid hydroxylase (fatty acid hydroxylase superfamily)
VVENWRSVLLSGMAPFSLTMLTSLLCALVVATLILVRRRRLKNRSIRLRTILRALVPRRFLRSASVYTDIGYFLLATFVFGAIVGWAMLSYQVVSNAVIAWLVRGFGASTPTDLSDVAVAAIMTVLLFLVYELAYWLDHYLSHRVPVLWEFHRVHHEATVLTPLTIFRIHPVDGWIHGNITALLLGLANGILNYAFGRTAYQYIVADSNLILVLFVHAYIHLQHSELWISFPGLLGRLLLSPAHHQVHHSTDPAHFNKNLGSCLAIWDWLFGTLYVPARQPQKLTFGVDPVPGEPTPERVHSIPRGLLLPFLRALARLKAVLGVRPPAALPVTRNAAEGLGSGQ